MRRAALPQVPEPSQTHVNSIATQLKTAGTGIVNGLMMRALSLSCLSFGCCTPRRRSVQTVLTGTS